jgi:hypothetical protein
MRYMDTTQDMVPMAMMQDTVHTANTIIASTSSLETTLYSLYNYALQLSNTDPSFSVQSVFIIEEAACKMHLVLQAKLTPRGCTLKLVSHITFPPYTPTLGQNMFNTHVTCCAFHSLTNTNCMQLRSSNNHWCVTRFRQVRSQ